MGRYSPDDIQRARQEIVPLKGHERKAKIREHMERTGASVSTIHRWIKQPDTGRKTRSDAGVARKHIPPEVYDIMIHYTALDWTAEMVVDMVYRNGLLPEKIHPQTYNALLKRDGLSRQDLNDPANFRGKDAKTLLSRQAGRRFRSPYTNHLQQVDTTEIHAYWFDTETGVIAFEANKGPNRASNGRPRVHLFSIIDDHSRVMYAELRRYRDAENWISFLYNAWSDRDDANPFQGLPETLYGDEDGATKATNFKRLMKDIGVVYDDHSPGNSGAKGKVEAGAIKYLKGMVTRLLRGQLDQGKKLTLSQANQILSDEVNRKNLRIHRTTKDRPVDTWTQGMRHPVRDMLSWSKTQEYLYITREVLIHPDITIYLDGVHIQLPTKRKYPFVDMYGRKVLVRCDRKKENRTHIQVQAPDGEWVPVKVKQATPDEAGQFKSLPTPKRVAQLERSQAVDVSGLDLSREPETEKAPPPKIVKMPPAPTTIPRRQAAILLARHGYSREEIAEICCADEIEKRIIDEKISTPKREAL